MNLEVIKKAIEIASFLEKPCSTQNADSLGIKIVILQRGWVIVGSITKEGQYFKVTNCYVIRRWGTENGLGQIAKNGPTADTKLDKNTDFQFHELTMVGMMDCEKEKWAEYVKI